MGKIRVLDDGAINRIAAGEVVERPASVVKELLENSLDAGARQIAIEVSGGGRQRILVSDDGNGMDRDDALLAIERHATSKIAGAHDLPTVATLGFRGEALAAIAAVAVLTLRTAERDGEGTLIEARGGTILSVRPEGMRRGTTLQVDRLFFNLPARRKFLRSESTELSHVTRWVVRYALAAPERSLRLTAGERLVLDARGTSDRRERIEQLFGAELAGSLLPFDRGEPGLRVHGYAGRPAQAQTRRDGQYVFVNGRAVQDRLLSHAVTQAYGNTVPSGRHPALFLFVEIDPLAVDVNVHPQKTEVRFGEPGRIHDFLRDALAPALIHRAAVPALADLRPEPSPGDGGEAVPDSRSFGPAPRQALTGLPFAVGEPPPAPYRPDRAQEMQGASSPSTVLEDRSQGEVGIERSPGSRAVPLGQLGASYILAEMDGGLLVVDQHAAHERVLFERYLAAAEADEVEVQRLMFPQTIELAPDEQLVMEREQDEFRRLGFLLEPFGSQAVRVDGIPAIAAELELSALLREFLGQANTARTATTEVATLRRRWVTTAACHAAIKVRHALSTLEMQRLLDDLMACASPSTCPHGRPIQFRLPKDEIERAFRRR